MTVPVLCGADPACRCGPLECTGHPMLYPYCAVCFEARLPLCEHGERGGGHWYPGDGDSPEWCEHLPPEGQSDEIVSPLPELWSSEPGWPGYEEKR